MKYQTVPKWDKYRPEYLKLGFVFAIGFVLMAFNYTTYPTDPVYTTDDTYHIEETEILPPRTPNRNNVLPPPPLQKIETAILVEPDDEPTFVETKSTEIFDDPADDTKAIIDAYASPKLDLVPAVVTPINEESPVDNSPLLLADRMPVYGDCSLDDFELARRSCTNKSVMKIIYSHIKYPTLARDNDIQGTVVVSFVVGVDGRIRNVEVLKDIGSGCGDAVLQAMKKLGKFYPGKHNGRPVSVIYRLPVKFTLQ